MDDPEFRDVMDISELAPHRLLEIKRWEIRLLNLKTNVIRFFEDYKKNENKSVQVDEIAGAEEAVLVVQTAMVTRSSNFRYERMIAGCLSRFVCSEACKIT